MKYGILKTAVNTGLDSELQYAFSSPMNVISNQPTYVQDMMNLKRKANSQNVQRWEIETSIELFNNSANYLVHSVTNGHNSEFYVRMPQVYGLNITNSNLIKTAEQINTNIDTFNSTSTHAFVPGEFIQFNGFRKVYMIKDGGINGVGVQIFPSARDVIPIDTTIITGYRVTMTAMYDTSTHLGITYTDGILSDPGSIKLIEAL